jgi:SAM-dependent methyltransferase
VLDVGCGDGHLLALLHAEATFPLALDGVELAAEAGAEAARRDIRVHHGRIEDVVLPASAYDLIIMNQLIEHVPDPIAVLRRVGAALRPGGHVVLETPNLDSLDARLFRRRYWGGYHLPRHFHLFDRRTLPRLVQAADLTTVAMRPLVCPQFWIISLANWLAARGRRRAAARWVSPFSPFWLAPATAIELVQARLWWTSNLQLVARRAA